MTTDRFERQERFFGKEGQEKVRASQVAIVGVGGLGSHVVQQLALLGVGALSLIDSEELAETDQNRYVTARHDDPIPGTKKVDIGERLVQSLNPKVTVHKVHGSLVSDKAFETILSADYIFGCLDSEGARLVLNELCAAYCKPYIDLATDILPGSPPTYGGRVCIAWNGEGCLICRGVLDMAEAQEDLAGEAERFDRDTLYGIKKGELDRSGPSVVSINGVLASLGVTEFMLAVTGIRVPKALMTYRGHMGTVSVSIEPTIADCYYCGTVRGKGDSVDVQRYIRSGVGAFLR